MSKVNDFVITVATANGSGSQSANNILVRSLFRMGLPVGGKNLFPSNIQGLPTWFTIRVNEQGFTARKKFADIVVAMNPQTATADLKLVRPGGIVFVNSEIKLPPDQLPKEVEIVTIPFREIVSTVTDSVKMKKLLANMIYVGVLAELLAIPGDVLEDVMQQQFGDKTSVIEPNKKALAAGRAYAAEHLHDLKFQWRAESRAAQNEGKILIDGNTAAAMGLVFGGCTVVAWYPITPSSSVIEHFVEFANKYRVEKDGKKNFAVVQAEDELASIAMVLGAGWAGARAMTATSGPGLSLMSEAAGLAYYAEIPSVIWDVQRVGPSTGLPTRTMQGDLQKAYYLSHGDTKHVVLLPGTPNECFEFGQLAFDLAEELQTLVIVLSELDIGMNLHVAHKFEYPTTGMDRGKVLNAEQLTKAGTFQRYKDVDGDGVPYRTLPGTEHPLAAYFTRGTGHDEAGLYTESSEAYKKNMDRLSRKFETARAVVPKPKCDTKPEAKIGLVTYGSTHEASGEARFLLQNEGVETNCIRLLALPMCEEFEAFIDRHDRVYVIEQNRDAQLLSIMRAEMPQYWQKCFSVLQYDGMPMDAEGIFTQIMEREASLT
jgi:2-oxoglutarate ferredoxin oxidoreductase subunit alpha